ncbi:MAG: PQQ-binding-like beta-propeller repeat protein [bacterium]
MRTSIILIALAAIAAAVPVGLEPVVVTGTDGTEQVYFRINTGTETIENFPAPAAGSPALGDTGVLWVDRAHRAAICQSIALSGDGMHVLANWYLNAERADYYRTLAGNVPRWTAPGSYSHNYGGQQIGASRDGRVLTLSSPSGVYKWSRTSGIPDWFHPYPVSVGGFSRVSYDGSTIAAAQNGTVYAFDAVSGETLWTAPFPEPTRLQGIDISDDGSVVAVTVYDSCLVYHNGVRRNGIPIGTSSAGTQYAAAVSGNGELIVTGDYHGRTRLWRWNGSTYVMRWSAQTGTPWVAGVGISRDGSTIACGSGYNDGRLSVFDSSSATPLWTYEGYGSQGAYVASVALSGDGSRIAAASWGDRAPSGTFKVFTVHDRASNVPLVGITRDEEPGSLFACDISDDGTFAAAGGKAVHAQIMGNGGQVYAIIVGAPESLNVGMHASSAPGRHIQVGQNITPAATVANYGEITASLTAFLRITTETDSLIYLDSTQVSDLAPGATRPVTFSNWTPAAYELYHCEFFTVCPGDGYAGDDTIIVKAKCFHDGRPEYVGPPFAENTVGQQLIPGVRVRNNGSYPDALSGRLIIHDSTGATVYEQTFTTAELMPESSATVVLPGFTPVDVGPHQAVAVAASPEDFYPGNDTLVNEFEVTWEIIYDDGVPDAYYWVGRRENDKFYVRFTPTLPPPLSLRGGRIYVNMANQPFEYVMVCKDDGAGRPDTNSVLQLVPNVMTPVAPGWIEFDLDVTLRNADDVWLICRWTDASQAMGVGADNTPPLHLRSHISSNQDTFQLWNRHDWMMRLTQSVDVGVAGEADAPRFLRLFAPRPNPFSRRLRLSYDVPVAGPVELTLYDAAGRAVTTLARGHHQPGHHSVTWQAEEQQLSAGLYFARLTQLSTGTTRVQKLVKLD